MIDRHTRAQAVCGRLARAFQATLQKRGLKGTCRVEQQVVEGREYLIPVFDWPLSTDHVNGSYDNLLWGVRGFTDGHRDEHEVKGAWEAYAREVLNGPAGFELARAGTEIAEEDAKPDETRAHTLLWHRRGDGGKELVIYERADHTNALNLLRWHCHGYTHIKVHGAGRWIAIRCPKHHEIVAAKEGQAETRKRMKASQSDDNKEAFAERDKLRAKEAIKSAVTSSRPSLDDLKKVKEQLAPAKGKKGRKKKV